VVPIILGFRDAHLSELEPAFKDSPDGVFYAQATQAVYGIGEAGLLWYNHLRIVLNKKFVPRASVRAASSPTPTTESPSLPNGNMLEEGIAGRADDAQALALTLERIKAAGLEMPIDDLVSDPYLDAFRSQLQASFPAGIVTQRLSDQSSIEYVSMRIPTARAWPSTKSA
jgi:hypothetical protein